jgi:methionine-rich copper-binding protein CopC
MRKGLVGFGVAVLFLLGTATPALAHNVLISTTPTKDSSVATGPDKVTLTFDQYVQNADVNQVAVTGPGGGQWAEGPVQVTDNVVSAPLRPLGPAGEYTIGYRVLSADGHSVAGEVKFTLTQAGTGTPAAVSAAKAAGPGEAAATGGSDGGVPIWVWIVGAVVLLGVGMTVALRTGKESAK